MTVRFWDEATMLSSVSDSGYVLGLTHPIPDPSIRKYGYGVLLHWAMRLWGTDGAVILNTFWWVVLALLPLVVLFRKREHWPELPRWAAYFLYVAAISLFPFVTKYVPMVNATIQSMALWMAFAVAFGRWLENRGKWWGVLSGCLLGFLNVTDFPKWLLPSVLAVAGAEIWLMLVAIRTKMAMTEKWQLAHWLFIGTNCWRTLRWIPAFVLLVAAVNRAWVPTLWKDFMSMSGPYGLNGIVPSWNFVIFLWYLGGLFWFLWLIGFTIWRRPKFGGPADSTVVSLVACAAAIILSFSFAIYPRPARMFVPAVPMLVLLVVISVGWLLRTAKWRQRGWRLGMAVGLIFCPLIFDLGVHAGHFGEYGRLSVGIDEAAEYVQNHADRFAPRAVGSYVEPILSANLYFAGEKSGTPPDSLVPVVPLMRGVPPDLNWTVLGEFTDYAVIDGQANYTTQSLGFVADQYRTRGVLGVAGVPTVAFDGNFYRSSYYLSEESYEGMELVRSIRRGRMADGPEWGVYFTGGVFGRPLPDTVGFGK